MSSKSLYCFVCDIAVTNRYFPLATCRTQSSKKKLVEKLGYLVGDQYMIVITEDDVICRSCANLMNTLDRLEVEMGSVKRVVLRFLERKYSLEEGELLNQKSDNQFSEIDKVSSSNFMGRKKKAEEELEDDVECNADDPRSRIWMQCDKCHYTTNYTSFVKNHIRDEICLDCEGPMKNGVCVQDCSNSEKITSSALQDSNTKTDSETMELIVNNMGFLNGGGNDETFSLISDSNIQGKLEVSFNVNESGEIRLREDKTEEKEEKPALYLQVVEDDDDDFENSNVRQVLTVTGDGAVEMMEVLWNEETNSPVAEIPF